MFIHNKRKQEIPKSIEIRNGVNIEVVNEFKLLGVTIDSKLYFAKHIGNLCLSINR
jgi:hypothetical protein